MDATEPRTDPAVSGTPPAERPLPPHPRAQPGPADSGWSAAAASVDPRRKSPLLACILSAMPGLGQVYVGYYKMGFIHMTVWGSAMALAIASDTTFPALTPLLVIFIIFFYLYNVIDAGRRAAFYNHALAGIEGVEVPTEMSLPTPGGSLAGGVVLIIVGLVFLSNTAFDVPLDWLEDWWPAAPLAVGAWLIVRGIQERQKTE
jgi:hypothetical protein